MVELFEYALVVMVSSLFVAGSAVAYGEFAAFESGLSLRAAFSGVSELATEATVSGTAARTMSIPSSMITCQGGNLSMEVEGSALSERVPLGCAFAVSVLAGVHTLEFSDVSSELELSVS